MTVDDTWAFEEGNSRGSNGSASAESAKAGLNQRLCSGDGGGGGCRRFQILLHTLYDTKDHHGDDGMIRIEDQFAMALWHVQ